MAAGARQLNRLVITIRPEPSDDGRLQVREAFQQVLDTLELFEQAQRSLGDSYASFVWRLEKASTSSPFTIIAVAEPNNPAIDIAPQVSHIKAEVAFGVRGLIAHGRPPSWLGRERLPLALGLLSRNTNGIAKTEIDFEEPNIDPLSIDRHQASAGLQAIEELNPIAGLDIPERSAYGEIEGQFVAVGHYRGRPSIQIRTLLYDVVSCVLSDALIARWGGEHKVSEVWEGKTVGVSGHLNYLSGGRLNRIDAEEIRELTTPDFNLDAILDPDFTSGLDPVEYLDKLHEGDLA